MRRSVSDPLEPGAMGKPISARVPIDHTPQGSTTLQPEPNSKAPPPLEEKSSVTGSLTSRAARLFNMTPSFDASITNSGIVGGGGYVGKPARCAVEVDQDGTEWDFPPVPARRFRRRGAWRQVPFIERYPVLLRDGAAGGNGGNVPDGAL